MNKITIHGPTQKIHAIKMIQGLTEEKVWEVHIKKATNKRTLSQNSLFHAWNKEIANEVGEPEAKTKSDLKAEFAPLVESSISGKMRPMDTSEMNTAQMSSFMDLVYIHATQFHGLFLPTPENHDA